MGKFRYRSESRREKELADEVQKEQTRLINGWFRKVLQTGEEWADEQHEKHVTMARANSQGLMMEACGVSDPANIDYDNPHVKIIWLMCDPVNQRLAHNPKLRTKLYDKMDEETYDVWMNYKDDNGHTYQELYESKLESAKATMHYRKIQKDQTKQLKKETKHPRW